MKLTKILHLRLVVDNSFTFDQVVFQDGWVCCTDNSERIDVITWEYFRHSEVQDISKERCSHVGRLLFALEDCPEPVHDSLINLYCKTFSFETLIKVLF
ncbi:unnamed protein product [Hermetia illucens]|uniref:Uncharacterized protein n=1 Tax=Hermetia illucens TaxID=343691 RepID=A0A7R8UAH9_HERIL|nr:unnamed protein product [Hermetia illucens]